METIFKFPFVIIAAGYQATTNVLSQFCRSSPIMKPVRLVVLAYSYVLTGKKVEKPYTWGQI